MNKESLIKKIKDFLKDHNEIIFAYVFGSSIEEQVFNDIDLGVYVNESDPKVKDAFYDIDLSLKLEKYLHLPVDVVLMNWANSIMIFRASKGVLVKNNDDNLRVDFITKHWKLYWDIKDRIREYIKERE